MRGGTRPQIFGSGQCFVSSVAQLVFGRNPLGITFLCLCLRSVYHYQKEAYFFPFILNVLLDFSSFEIASLISQRDLPDDLSQKVITEAVFFRALSICS